MLACWYSKLKKASAAPRVSQAYANFSDIVIETASWNSAPSSDAVGTVMQLCAA
ncbi:hypothetical protein WN48_02381 [Eufriesea mexicana]|nr:hypothetical protein WN48_02381 [Eufriesea mexicana]